MLLTLAKVLLVTECPDEAYMDSWMIHLDVVESSAASVAW